MNPCRPILAPLLCVAAALPALAAAKHYAITQEQIAAALTSTGLQVSPDQISPHPQVVAFVDQPTLEVKFIQPAGGHRLIARMECAQAAQCLPFLVTLRMDRSSPALDGSAPAPPPPPANWRSGSSHSQPLLVRAGSSAVLLLDGAHVHISIPVICLDGGALGQTVRATNPDRKHLYSVQVAGDRLLRGRL